MEQATLKSEKNEVAIFACGCFWCLEAQFQHLQGVIKIEPGFTGGHLPHPTYKQVCTGKTGHAESCRITFDPEIISYAALLGAFFKAHDPTQLNRQGNDIGTQYRSALFYLNQDQKKEIEKSIHYLEEHEIYNQPIATQVVPASAFYPAEDYHKDYYNQHRENPYCNFVVQPKVNHFLAYLKEKDKLEKVDLDVKKD